MNVYVYVNYFDCKNCAMLSEGPEIDKHLPRILDIDSDATGKQVDSMSRRIFTVALLSYLAISGLGSAQFPFPKYRRDAACTTCSQDSPDTLSSPWYGIPAGDPIRPEYRTQQQTAPAWWKNDLQRPILPAPYPSQQHENPTRERGSQPSRNPIDNPIDYRPQDLYPYSSPPFTAPAPRPGSSLTPNFPGEPLRRPLTHINREKNYRNLLLNRGRLPLEERKIFRSQDQESDYPNRSSGLLYRSQQNPKDQGQDSLSPIDKNRRIGVINRSRLGPRLIQKNNQNNGEVPRRERSREAEILRVTEIQPEFVYADDDQPDFSVLRFVPPNRDQGIQRHRGFYGGPVWEEEEMVDIREETPFGMSETMSMDKESFGPGGFQEERITEEFDNYGWLRQAGTESLTGHVVIQNREVPKDHPHAHQQHSQQEQSDLHGEGSSMVKDIALKPQESVMKVPPRSVNHQNFTREAFIDSERNPEFYRDIEYPPTNDSQRENQPGTEESTTPASQTSGK